MIKAAGGNPIVMNQSEVFTSAQRGVIDGVQTAVPGYLDSGLYEVCKYMSTWPLGVMGLAVTMNKDSWNKLGPSSRVRSWKPGTRRRRPRLQGRRTMSACRSEGQEPGRPAHGSDEGRTGQAGFVCRPERRELEAKSRT